MAKAAVLLLLFPFISVVFSKNTCRWGIVNRYNTKTPYLPASASVYLENTTVWFPLMTADDASGVKSMKMTFGALNVDSMPMTLTTVKTDGTSTTTSGTFSANKNSLMFTDNESDGVHELYPFMCSDNLMGAYRCKPGASGGDQFFAVARQSDTSADVETEIESCRRTIRNIANWVTTVTLSHPDE